MLARITDNSAAKLTKLKVHGSQTLAMLVPSLQRVKSIVDQDLSSVLLDSAVKVVFRCFHEIAVKYHKLASLSGQDVARVTNVLKCEHGHPLEPQLNRGSIQSGGGYRQCELCRKRTYINSNETYYSCQECNYNYCNKCFSGFQNSRFNFEVIEDLLDKDKVLDKTTAVVEEETFGFSLFSNDCILAKDEPKILDTLAHEEIFLKYCEVFLDDLIRMMLVLTSVSGVSTSACEVLIKIARPEYIKTLFELLLTPIKIEHLYKLLTILENL